MLCNISLSKKKRYFAYNVHIAIFHYPKKDDGINSPLLPT